MLCYVVLSWFVMRFGFIWFVLLLVCIGVWSCSLMGLCFGYKLFGGDALGGLCVI